MSHGATNVNITITHMPDTWNTGATLQQFIQLALVQQLWMMSFYRLHFYSYLLPHDKIT